MPSRTLETRLAQGNSSIIESGIREILQNQGKMSGAANRVRADDDLYAAGLSSLATVNVMLAIETRFDIEIPDESLNRETFRCVAALTALVTRLQAEAA